MTSTRVRAAMMAAFNRNRDGPEIAPKAIQGRKPSRMLRISFIFDENLNLGLSLFAEKASFILFISVPKDRFSSQAQCPTTFFTRSRMFLETKAHAGRWLTSRESLMDDESLALDRNEKGTFFFFVTVCRLPNRPLW